MKRIGRWIDFENDYKTLDPSFMESVWWVFSTLHKKGLVYQGFKVCTVEALASSQFKPTPISRAQMQHASQPAQ